jgi:hypothetical protein
MVKINYQNIDENRFFSPSGATLINHQYTENQMCWWFSFAFYLHFTCTFSEKHPLFCLFLKEKNSICVRHLFQHNSYLLTTKNYQQWKK